MRPFWYQTANNYGDVLTPHILRAFSVPFKWANKSDCDSLVVGSIARWARPGVSVFGSGFMRANDPVCVDADWRFVRGPISRQMIIDAGGECPELYGDPALLLPMIWPAATKRWRIGIVPHYVDLEYARRTYGRLGYPIISLSTKDCLKTTRQITQCRMIISSSLHGIIVAHAYGIPAAWVRFSNNVRGDGTKFRDHHLSVGVDAVLSTVKEPVFIRGDIRLIDKKRLKAQFAVR